MIDKSIRYAYQFGGHPGASHEGAGSGQTSSSGGGGGGGGGNHVDTGAARRAQAATDALNARRAAEATARENEAREVAREKQYK